MNQNTNSFSDLFRGAWIVARREIRDQLRDWRIITPIIILTLLFPILMEIAAKRAVSFVNRYGAYLIADRLIPFLLLVVGFFPISISLVIALESFAGERERRSLEPLLATPLTDGQLYLGKMLASMLAPLMGAFFGIFVYLIVLIIEIGWEVPLLLIVQVVLLTTAQALVMVSGAVVISSQATSVRSANLLASFVIIPVAMLVIGESMIMFWANYNALWLILAALIILATILSRMGLHLFNREYLLGREIDSLNLKWAGQHFWETFIRGAKSIPDWYHTLFKRTIPQLKYSMLLMAVALTSAFFIGSNMASKFILPKDVLQLKNLDSNLMSQLADLGIVGTRGWLWVFWNNVRATGLATLLGIFSFGIAAVILLMIPIGIIGYFSGNVILAGQDVMLFLGGLVFPHAVVEVPAAILCGAVVLNIGLAMISPSKGCTLGESFVSALAEWARVVVGLILPLLMIAAAIEVFITPRIAIILLSGN